MEEQKEKSTEWRDFLSPFENKRLLAAAKNIGIPPHRKGVIMHMAFECFIKTYSPNEETSKYLPPR